MMSSRRSSPRATSGLLEGTGAQLVHDRCVFGVDGPERNDPRQGPERKQQEPGFHDGTG